MSTPKKKAAASVVWFEIPADNLDRAKTFYGKLFGWKIAPFPGMTAPEAQNYLHIDTGGKDASPDGGMMTRMYPGQAITQYVSVPSVAKAAAKIQQLGGEICKTKTAVPGMGYFAICKDTEGNTFAVWEMNQKAK
ncbi:MAG TPA: VOC family protein [Candidatus Saccharimonadales bacterium]|nr:VOC family protein [Candidatus Saccharimonadales bacterium]